MTPDLVQYVNASGVSSELHPAHSPRPGSRNTGHAYAANGHRQRVAESARITRPKASRQSAPAARQKSAGTDHRPPCRLSQGHAETDEDDMHSGIDNTTMNTARIDDFLNDLSSHNSRSNSPFAPGRIVHQPHQSTQSHHHQFKRYPDFDSSYDQTMETEGKRLFLEMQRECQQVGEGELDEDELDEVDESTENDTEGDDYDQSFVVNSPSKQNNALHVHREAANSPRNFRRQQSPVSDSQARGLQTTQDVPIRIRQAADHQLDMTMTGAPIANIINQHENMDEASHKRSQVWDTTRSMPSDKYMLQQQRTNYHHQMNNNAAMSMDGQNYARQVKKSSKNKRSRLDETSATCLEGHNNHGLENEAHGSQAQQHLLDQQVDHDRETLRHMPYDDLAKESFDVNPRALPIDAASGSLVDQLHGGLKVSSEEQRRLFDGMSIEHWNEAGDWFLDQFTEVMKKMRKARQEKREIAMKFEEKIGMRQHEVEVRDGGIEKSLGEMKRGGRDILFKNKQEPKAHEDSEKDS